jgi:transposase-like protein
MERGKLVVREKWSHILKEQAESGLTAGKFCEKHGYAFHQIRYWRQKLRSGAKAPRFAPVVKSNESPRSRIESKSSLVVTIGNLRIEISSGFDRKLLTDVLQALGGDA